MFARHKLGGGSRPVEWLRENHFIAINWDDSPSTDENDYGDDGRSRAYQEVRRMRQTAASEQDAIVGAYYGNKVGGTEDRMVIGRVDPDAEVHIVHYVDGEDPVAYESEAAAREAGVPDVHEQEGSDKTLDGEWIYKALPLVGCMAYDERMEVSFVEYPILSALRPRHHSFCKWPSAKYHLRGIDAGVQNFREVEDKVNDPSDLLGPSQLEVICNEYLRESATYGNYRQLLPVGRTLRDVDIVGQTDAGRLFAQVTKATGSKFEEKGQKLGPYRSSATGHLILFGPEREPPELPDGVSYEVLEDVLAEVDKAAPEFLTTMYELVEPDAMKSI